MESIVKRQFEDQVRFLLLQFPLDVNRVVQEATEYFGRDVDLEQVVRVQKKLKSSQDRDAALWVASNITQKLFRDIHQRQAKLEAMYMAWAGAEQGVVSLCCTAPVEKKIPMQGAPYYTCLSCCINCNVKTAKYPEIERLKMKIIQEMRKEDELLVRFAKDLGFTVRPSQGTKEFHSHNNFVMVGTPGGAAPQQQPVPIDVEAAKRLEDMTPVERERVIQNLERMSKGTPPVVDTEFVSDPGKDTSSGQST